MKPKQRYSTTNLLESSGKTKKSNNFNSFSSKKEAESNKKLPELNSNEITSKTKTRSESVNFSVNEGKNILSSLKNQENSGDTNIRVLCRVRPMNKKETELNEACCIDFITKQTIKINVRDKEKESKPTPHEFTFDRVFDTSTTQSQIYEETAKPVVKSIIDGFNGTILAYGQTSSGKSFTMQGVLNDDNLKGLTPRIVEDIFSRLNSMTNISYKVTASVFEIYQEKIMDLLNISNTNLNIRENKAKGIYVENLQEIEVNNLEEVMKLINTSMDNRTVSATNMNETSSRSHLLFSLNVLQINNDDLSQKEGKLYLVDLAGSEKISKTGATGVTLDEAKGINKSLTILGMVIKALTETDNGFVPYRDSKLTRILSESLGGNSKTSLVITLSPSSFNEFESLSSIRFGIRAKKIKNKAKINKATSIPELQLQISKLRLYCVDLESKYERLCIYIKSQGMKLPSDEDLVDLLDSNNQITTTQISNQVDKDIKSIQIIDNSIIDKENIISKGSENNSVTSGKEEIENGGFNANNKMLNNTIGEEESYLEQTFIKPKSKLIDDSTINLNLHKPLLAINRNKNNNLDETVMVNQIKEINEIEDIKVRYVDLLYVLNEVDREKQALSKKLEAIENQKDKKINIVKELIVENALNIAYCNNNEIDNNMESNCFNKSVNSTLNSNADEYFKVKEINQRNKFSSEYVNESQNTQIHNNIIKTNDANNEDNETNDKINKTNNSNINSNSNNVFTKYTPIKHFDYKSFDINNLKLLMNKSNKNIINNIEIEKERDKENDKIKANIPQEDFFDTLEEILYDLEHIYDKYPEAMEIKDMIRIYNSKLRKLKNKLSLKNVTSNVSSDAKKTSSLYPEIKPEFKEVVLKDIEKRASKLINYHIKSKPGVENVIYNPSFVKWNLNNFKNKFKKNHEN